MIEAQEIFRSQRVFRDKGTPIFLFGVPFWPMTTSFSHPRSDMERSYGTPGRSPLDHTEPSDPAARTESQWPELVRRLQAGDRSAMEELYRVFSDGIRFYLWRQVGPQELPDKLHDLFLIVTQSIQNGDLREPERLMGYVRTIVRRQVAGHIQVARQQRRTYHPLEWGNVLQD